MSLRTRLLLGTLVIALVLAVSGVAVIRTTRANLVDQVDARLALATSQLGRAPLRSGGPLESDAVRLSDLYGGFVTDRGVLVTRLAPDLADGAAATPVIGEAAVAELRAGRTVTVPSDDPQVDYRMAGRPDRAGTGLVVVGIPLDGVDESTRRLFVVQGIAFGAAIAVLGLVTWWVVHIGVRPVRRMTATAEAIAAGDLSARVPEGAPGTEAGDLGVALNGMLGRIEEAFQQRAASEERLRQFVADASHELRTPVATIRGYAELHRTGALADPAALDDAMRRTEQEAVRMGGLVDDLLHLARLDQGRPLEQEPVDLAVIAADAVQDARAVAPEREIRLDATEPVVVTGDEARLRQVVTNLVGNALAHAPGAAVTVRVERDATAARLEVADDGPGMAEADADRAFERFYRADAARSRQHGGSGLGLSIVEATVRAHGGAASLTSAPGQGTSVTVTLPLRTGADG